MNNIHEYSEFKLTKEDNNITHLDLSIERNSNDLHQGFNRKLTQTGTTTHHTSNHPLEHKLAAYNFYVNSMMTLPITEQAKQQEWNIILTVAKYTGFLLQIIRKLKNKIILTTQKKVTLTQQKKWFTFIYHIPYTHKVTSLFKNTNLIVAFQTSSTIYNQLRNRIPLNKINSNGIYKLKYKTCNNSYTGQTGDQ